jgi:hypothetical protein
MRTPRTPTQKGVSLGISLLMLVLSVVVPVLERAEVENAPVAESSHNPAECPTGHDHTICVQVGTNLSAPAGEAVHALAFAVTGATTLRRSSTLATDAFFEGHPSRGPPLV